MTQKALEKTSTAGRFVLVVAPEESSLRLDRFLASHFPELSRARLQQLVDAQRVEVNGRVCKRSHHLEAGETVIIEIPVARVSTLEPEAVPLEVLYEDADLAILNKPAGLVVHPGGGARSGTLVQALLHRFPQLSSVGGPLRPGIVHRLDKGTSGVLVVALRDAAHHRLAEQFSSRNVSKTYLALVHGYLRGDSGRIELPIARDLRRRVRMTARRREGRPARTDWRVVLRVPGFTLVAAELHTGRTHQIRVHFSALGHPVVGDTLYGAPRFPKISGKEFSPLERPFLHAWRIAFAHPLTGKPVEARASLPGELADYFRRLARASGAEAEAEAIDAALRPFL
ncbi:MAG: RluA family pseudouridine synthase [Candidatus Acidiferrales bacterium]